MSLVPSGKESTARRRIGTASAARPCWINEKPSAFRLAPSPEEEEGGGEDAAGLAWLSAAGAATGLPPPEAASELALLFPPFARLSAFASFFGVEPPPESPPTSAKPAAVRPASTTSVTASTAAVRDRPERVGTDGGRKGSRRGARAVIG